MRTQRGYKENKRRTDYVHSYQRDEMKKDEKGW